MCHSDLTVDVMPGPDTFSFMSPKNVMPDAASNPQREAPADGKTILVVSNKTPAAHAPRILSSQKSSEQDRLT